MVEADANYLSNAIQTRFGLTGTEQIRSRIIVNAGPYAGMFEVLDTEERGNPVKIDDGLIDLFAVPHSRLEVLQAPGLVVYTSLRRALPNLPPPLGVHIDRSSYFSLREVNKRSLKQMHTDGEPIDIATDEIHYTTKPKELTLIVPTQGPRSYFS